jgi:radical SAM-linked protein
MVRPRVRIRFSKQSALRLIGHRDLMRSLERAICRAGLALSMSEGYRPKPRMHFPLALAVGLEGRREVMELELHEAPSADELLARLHPQAPAGLGWESLEVLPPGGHPLAGRKARAVGVSYEIAVPSSRLPGLEEEIQRLWSASTLPVQRPNRMAPVDVRPVLIALGLRTTDADRHVLEMRLKTDSTGGAGPRDVLAALDLDDLERQGTILVRSNVEIVP